MNEFFEKLNFERINEKSKLIMISDEKAVDHILKDQFIQFHEKLLNRNNNKSTNE